MRAFVTSKNVKWCDWCHLIWHTLYIRAFNSYTKP